MSLSALLRVAMAGLLLVGAGCGGNGDDCDGFVTINAPVEECNARAERLGCDTVEVNGPTCGLFGCVRCTGDGDDASDP